MIDSDRTIGKLTG